VLDYFDAFVIGLTATPSRHTLGYFNQNLVAEFPYGRTCADLGQQEARHGEP
jgi:type I restriction enzyme, R subunit